MKPAEYWQKRSEQVAQGQFDKADSYIARLRNEYAKAKRNIRDAVELFYKRYAENDEVSLAAAKKALSGKELNEFRMTLEEFTQKAKNNADGRWTKQLNAIYYKTRVSRLEALQTQVRQEVELLAGSRQQGAHELLGDVCKDTYYRTLYELQKGVGFGASFARINKNGLETVLGTEFAGSNWSKRIWVDRDKLWNELRTKLTQSFIRGDSSDKTVKDLMERFDVSRSNAERLVQTETSFFTGQASAAGYKASGIVKKYELIATLDSKTSQICRSMDGKVFNLSEMEVGVNYPPFHAHCRTTQAPYFDDEVSPGERAARDEEGKIYYVPGDITYEEWQKKYVDSQDSPKGGTIKSDQQFADILDKTPQATAEYKTVLADRFAGGSDIAKRIFVKYVKNNVVKSTNTKAAHYNPADQVINMDFDDDLNNPRGAGATYFHEHGHFVDNMAAIDKLGKQTYDGISHIAIGSIGARDFYKAILSDVQKYLEQYVKDKNVSWAQAQKEIKQRFSQTDSALYSAISDIYGGATGNQLRGDYGHSSKYWKQLPNALEKEAFAHMFEASFDSTGKRLDLIKEYLPSAYEVFRKILEEI